jgi:cobalt transporter subunit CbtA
MAFRNILLSAIVVGVFSGLLYGLFQHYQISPIIYAAEAYEVEDAVEWPAAHGHTETTGHHEHNEEAWGPEDGAERIGYTIGADIAIGIAYALFMISLMALHNLKANKPKLTMLTGAAWGIASMVIFFAAPAMFGLHPEVPGTEAAALENRQGWWTLCVSLTAAGIAVLYYVPLKFKLGGLILAIMPHMIGAPMPEHHTFANTDPLAIEALTLLTTQFYLFTAVGMGLFFVLLGALSGLAVQRFVKLDA